MLRSVPNDMPLERTVREVMTEADQSSIPAFIEAAKRALRDGAAKAKEELDPREGENE